MKEQIRTIIGLYNYNKEGTKNETNIICNINPGYPLNSISKYKIIDKYFTEITDEDKEKIKISEDDVVEFISKHS